MILVPKATLRALVRFGKAISDSQNSKAVFDLLGSAVVESCDLPAAVLFQINDEGELGFVSSHGISSEGEEQKRLSGGTPSEVADLVQKTFQESFSGAISYPLISDSALYGAVVVLFDKANPLNEWQNEILQELVELASTGLSKIVNRERLEKTSQELLVSQDTLARTERLRTLGQMSASISHDIKNLLVPLSLQTDFLIHMAEENPRVTKIAERLKQNVFHAIEVLERLRDFSRQTPDTANIQEVEINSLTTEAFELCKARAGSGIQFFLDQGESARIRVSSSELVSAIVNLITNAVDALNGTGKIWLRSGATENQGWIVVADNGPGIPKELQSRVLEPFFTTKGEKGTGLGLSMVYALTQRHGGQFAIQSELGQGATFKLSFPLSK